MKLSKGSTIKLAKDTDFLKDVKVILSWETPENSNLGTFDLDATCYGLIKSDIEGEFELFDEDYFIFYEHPETSNQSIVHSGDDKTGADGEEINVHLDKIPDAITHISFFVTIHRAFKKKQHFGHIVNSSIKIMNSQNDEVIGSYVLNEAFSDETAVHFGTIYRGADGWEFKAIGQGYKKELADILYSYGVEV